MAANRREIQVIYRPELVPVEGANPPRNELRTTWKAREWDRERKAGGPWAWNGHVPHPIYLFAPRPPQQTRPEWEAFRAHVEQFISARHEVLQREPTMKALEFVWSPEGGTIEKAESLEQDVREEFFLFSDAEILEDLLKHVIDPAEEKWAATPAHTDEAPLQLLHVFAGPEDLLIRAQCKVGDVEFWVGVQGYLTKQQGKNGSFVWDFNPIEAPPKPQMDAGCLLSDEKLKAILGEPYG